MKKRKQWLFVAVILLLIFGYGFTSVPIMAADSDSGILLESPPVDEHFELIRGAELSTTTKLDLWHYSGGYWKVTNPGSQAITVSDKTMAQGMEQIIPANEANFTLNIPAVVKEQIAAGKKVVPMIQSGSSAKLSEIFENDRTFSINNSTLTFSARPKFNLIPTRELSFKDPFKLGIPVTVPLIERKYGYNMYSVFGNGYKAVQVNGWVNRSDPTDTSGMPRGWIHPGMITDTSGTIAGGKELVINSRYLPSDGFSVGEGTFSNAGALGLCFEYPVKFTFYVYNEDHVPAEPEEPDEPEEPAPGKKICQKCGQCELTEEGVCTERTCADFGTGDCGCFVPPDIQGQALLSLPNRTYETHPVRAEDRSTFSIGGVAYSAVRAYAENYARNSFQIVESNTGGRVSRLRDSDTEADVTFPHKGSYHVQLRVSPRYGGRLYDTKPVEVLKTPTVIASLGGTQKQNRKQVLNIKVATNADNPLRELYVEIRRKGAEDPAAGSQAEDQVERVRLVNHLDGRKNVLQNSETIKTRAIVPQPSDQYWTNCRLEFLTKNARTEDFSYYVYARDSRGLWDEAEEDFTVVPDRAPEAAINVEPAFLRNSGTNTAVIAAEDGSKTDGDQLERTWSVANAAGYDGISDVFTSPTALDPFENAVFTEADKKPGYRDNSFGTKKSIEFERAGVGKLQLKLHVKDVWTEETLEEYIAEEDYLTASALAVTEVTNVAPLVSLEPLRSRTAEILMLAGGDEEYRFLKDSAAGLAAELLGNAVDPQITVEKMAPAPGNSITYSARAEARVNYGFQGGWSGFWEEGSWAVDDHRLYKAEATWVQGVSDYDDYPNLPFTIAAYDGKQEGNMTPVWNCSITRELVGTADQGYGAYFAQDNDNKYLYFFVAGKTVIIDKESGSILTALPYAIGRSNSVYGRSIYTYQTDGIYRISMGDGTAKKIFGFHISPEHVRRIGGEDHFLVRSAGGVDRGIFDPRAEQLRMERLPGTEDDDSRTAYRLAGADTQGKLIVSCVTPRTGGAGDLRIRVYGQDNTLLKTVGSGLEHTYQDYVVPIYDSGGVANYVGLTSNVNASKYKRTRVQVWGINNGYSGSTAAEERKDNGYPAKADRILMGIEHGDGNVYVMVGGEYIFIADQGYNGAAHGMAERARAFRFDVKKGTAAECNLGSGVWSGLNSSAEYASRSDAYIAVSTGDNNQYANANHTTKLVSWGQSMDEILTRYFNRGLSGGKDLSAVVVLDNSNEASAEAPADLASLLREKRAGAFLFASANGAVRYGAHLAGAMGAAGRVSSPEQLAEAAAAALLKDDGGGDVLQLTARNGNSYMERSYKLKPGMQYFYEYDYQSKGAAAAPAASDLLQISGQYARVIPQGDLLDQRYVVTDSFAEDFSDTELNPFFSLSAGRVSGGKYRLAYCDGRSSSNRYRRDSSAFTFTVPEGKQGVLVFDYDILRENNGDYNAGYYVDGAFWKNFIASNQASGHYTHPELLGPGTHTVSALCGDYGKSHLCWCVIDDLRVDLTELSENGAGPAADAVVSWSDVSGDSWRRVRGSFLAPNAAAAYTAVPADCYYLGNLSAWGPYHSWVSRERGNKELIIDAGGTAAYLNIGLRSRIDKAVNYRIDSRTGNYSLSARKRKENRDEIKYLPDYYPVNWRNMSGTVTAKVSHSTYNTSSNGDFSDLEIVTPERPSAYALTGTNRFLIAGKADGERGLFVENDRFTGEVAFRFVPGAAGDYLLKNLKIYSIQNGVKVYVEDSTMAESNTVTRWKTHEGQLSVVRAEKAEEDQIRLIYRKGELVAYNVNYFDYEKDPSKKQSWRYTHTPFNDGPHPQAAIILDGNGNAVSAPGTVLDKPIDRFYVDGKYTVEHWQEDNTTRGRDPAGNPNYDKASNTASLTFYVQGGGEAPWITHIRTVPGSVKENHAYRIGVGVDDREKDPLQLTTEVYFEGRLIHTERRSGITAGAGGRYPEVLTDIISEKARPGRYEVVCTVRDWSGTGLDSSRFTVVTEGNILGSVSHRDQWEQNRKKYNLNRFGTEFSKIVDFSEYKGQKAPRRRGTNVFWSGEEFVLRAVVSGDPRSVSCQIAGEPYGARMTATGERTGDGDMIYWGTIWHRDMLHRWGRPSPEELTFQFTARYGGDVEKTHSVSVIVDDSEEYWQLHRIN